MTTTTTTTIPFIAPDPFTTYSCMGDDLGKGEEPEGRSLYTRPFRFHVYQDMPVELLGDVVRWADKFWKPEDA